MSRSSTGKGTKPRKNNGPIRVIVRCAWNGLRLSVPPNDNDSEPIRGSTKLLDVVERLKPSLPSSLFESDDASEDGPGATLICVRKAVAKAEWGRTTLSQILDGDDGSAGVLLTLDLGGSDDGAGRGTKEEPRRGNAIASAASSLNIKPVVMSGSAAPMEISPPERATPEEAWSNVLGQNFDAASKECLMTMLKIIDNLLSRPHDPKVRSIRCSNAAFDRKVGKVKGSFNFMYSFGFKPRYPLLGTAAASAGAQPDHLDFDAEGRYAREGLLRARKVLTTSATKDLNMDEEDLPKPPIPPPALAPSGSSAANAGGQAQFNVYRTHSHNVQSAAMGAPDPYTGASASVSTTERQLQQLQAKKTRMEKAMQSDVPMDRGLVAYLPGNGPQSFAAAAVSSSGGNAPAEGKGDSSLVAARMKRMEEERKKREEGGFTTKAMRDLEKIKKAKVYSHAQIRINFADGTHLHAKFLPSEKVSAIRSIIQSSFEPSLASFLAFDLYVAPPRRLLDDNKRLDQEELVPAAKIHVSWNVGPEAIAASVPDGGVQISEIGCFLKKELFRMGDENGTAAFPQSKNIVEKRKQTTQQKSDNNGKDSDSKSISKEEAMMQRMMGKSAGLFGGVGKKSSNNKSNDKKSGGGSKPKWFK